jgi:predicted GNAT family acetyltransferase
MKSDTEEPSNNRPTLVNVGRRKLVSFARRLTGYREISSICTHTEHRGNGYAARLTQFLIDMHSSNGMQSFLHVGEQNASAKALYEKLGFSTRNIVEVNLYRRL